MAWAISYGCMGRSSRRLATATASGVMRARGLSNLKYSMRSITGGAFCAAARFGRGVTSSQALLPLLALVAGVLSFSSPCALPLLPGYLGFMSGVSAGRGRTMLAATLFVLGFAFVFTALGWAASS